MSVSASVSFLWSSFWQRPEEGGVGEVSVGCALKDE